MVIAATDTNVADDMFRLNTEIDYKKPCFNNGTYCSAVAVCNYTFFKPDNTVLIDNVRATNNIAYHSYKLYFPEVGIYKIDMVCSDGSRNGAETFYAEVSGSGFNDTIWFYVLILVFSAGIMILGFCLYDQPIVILGTFGLYFLGIYIIRYGIVGMQNLTTTWAIGIIVLAVAMYVSVKSAWSLINDNK